MSFFFKTYYILLLVLHIIGILALEEQYLHIFRKECNQLSQVVLQSLIRLDENPKDADALQRLLQASDIIMGNSRFVSDWELEWASTNIIQEFSKIPDASRKGDEIKFFHTLFSKLIKSQAK